MVLKNKGLLVPITVLLEVIGQKVNDSKYICVRYYTIGSHVCPRSRSGLGSRYIRGVFAKKAQYVGGEPYYDLNRFLIGPIGEVFMDEAPESGSMGLHDGY